MSRTEFMWTVGALRRRMPRHLLPVFCLSLLLLGCACGPGHAGDGAPARGIPLFAAGRTKVLEEVNGSFALKGVGSFDSLFLAAGNGVMVALAEARRIDSGNDEFEMTLGLVDTQKPRWERRITQWNNWDPRWINQTLKGVHYALRSPAAVVKGNKVYVLSLISRGLDDSKVFGRWRPVPLVGDIVRGPIGKEIELGATVPLHFGLEQEVDRKGLSVFPGHNYSALLTSKGRVVFSATATNREGTEGFAIMQWKEDEEQWEVSFVKGVEGCSIFSLFEWKKKLISMFSACSDGDSYMSVYDEAHGLWKDAEDTFSRLWNRKRKLRSLTSVTIGNKNVLLFTEECSSQDSVDGNCNIPLWFSDGGRVHEIGSIYAQRDKAASGRFVYTGDGLFSLHHQKRRGSDTIVLTRLDDELWKIRSALKAWAKKDAYLSRPCNATAPKGASPDTLCVTPMPTAGLVGFLSDVSGVSYWQDEYRFMNAVARGERVKRGYMFRGAHSGAVWSVGRRNFGAWYDFEGHGLTVMATVTVHETPKGDTPLLTVGGDGVYERLGLWHKDGQWKVVSKNGKEGPAVYLEVQTQYRVALVVQDNAISAYVNGKTRGRPLPILPPEEKLLDITYIFIGGYAHRNGSRTTVTNVLLYNRVLSDTELEAASRTVAAAK